MKRRLSLVVVILLLLLPTYANADLLGVRFSASDQQVVRINETTGSLSVIGNTGFSNLNSLDTSSAGTVYSATYWGWNNARDRHLIAINSASGVGANVATLNVTYASPIVVEGLAVSPAGIIYAASNPGTTPGVNDLLYTINPTTGVGTYKDYMWMDNRFDESKRVRYVKDIAFAPNGTLYGWDDNLGLFKILNPETGGESIDVNPLVNVWDSSYNRILPQILDIAFTPEGKLYGISSEYVSYVQINGLYQINLETGELTKITTYDIPSGNYHYISGLAYSPSAIPLPASLVLLGSGLLSLTGWRRFRKS
jgi:hypothetical protein